MKNRVLTSVCALILAASTVAATAQEIVRIGPPPPRKHEFRPPPSPAKHLWGWVPGYYHFDGSAYVWVPGAYVEGPTDHPHWIEGHWDAKDGGYVWTEGSWRT